jgi:hypothetical protein
MRKYAITIPILGSQFRASINRKNGVESEDELAYDSNP